MESASHPSVPMERETCAAFCVRMDALLKLEKEADDKDKMSQSSLPESYLLKKGVLLDPLVLSSSQRSARSGGRHLVQFSEPNKDTLPAHKIFRCDVVGIFKSASAVSDLTNEIAHGVVDKVTENSVTVSVNNDDSDGLSDLSESGAVPVPLFKVMCKGDEVTFRRDEEARNLMRYNAPMNKKLFCEADLSPPVDVPEIKFVDQKLDESQKEAVRLALSRPQCVTIIHGPPGTGKTAALAEVIVQMVKLNQKVLVCAPSNIAVDTLLERVVVLSGATDVHSCPGNVQIFPVLPSKNRALFPFARNVAKPNGRQIALLNN